MLSAGKVALQLHLLETTLYRFLTLDAMLGICRALNSLLSTSGPLLGKLMLLASRRSFWQVCVYTCKRLRVNQAYDLKVGVCEHVRVAARIILMQSWGATSYATNY